MNGTCAPLPFSLGTGNTRVRTSVRLRRRMHTRLSKTKGRTRLLALAAVPLASLGLAGPAQAVQVPVVDLDTDRSVEQARLDRQDRRLRRSTGSRVRLPAQPPRPSPGRAVVWRPPPGPPEAPVGRPRNSAGSRPRSPRLRVRHRPARRLPLPVGLRTRRPSPPAALGPNARSGPAHPQSRHSRYGLRTGRTPRRQLSALETAAPRLPSPRDHWRRWSSCSQTPPPAPGPRAFSRSHSRSS